jgi:signal transduction histidine kinase
MEKAQTHVLILEDNEGEAQALSAFLELQGWRVTVAHTAAEAIALGLSQSFTVALCDIYLGEGGNGIEAARALQAQSDLPILFMSARSDSQTWDEALALSPYGVLRKPFALADVLTTLTTAIARHARERRDLERAAQWQDERLALVCRIRRELGSPLAKVGLTVDRLRLQGRALSGAQLEAALTRIEQSVQKVYQTLDGMFEALCQEAQRRSLCCQDLTPQALQMEVCAPILAELEPQARAQNCPIITCWEFATAAIALDRQAVQTILYHLLRNALQYSKPNHSIRLHIQVMPETVCFQVGDRGAGLSPDLLAKCLELFQQKDCDPNFCAQNHLQNEDWCKLKKAVDLHQGTLTLESVLGQGTTVTVTLPNFAQASRSDTSPEKLLGEWLVDLKGSYSVQGMLGVG